MAKKPVSTATNVNEIEKTWKVAHASHRVNKFLKTQGIEPVSTIKFGKGYMYMYTRDVLTNMELKQAYLKYINRKYLNRTAPTPKVRVPSNGVDYSATLDSITTALMRLEGKVDALKLMWNTPVPVAKVWDEDQKSEHGH